MPKMCTDYSLMILLWFVGWCKSFWGQCNFRTYVYALESVSMTSKTPWNPQNCCFADVFPFPRYRSSDSSGLFSGVGRLHIVWIMSMHVCNAIQKIAIKSGHLMFLCLANLGNTISWIKLETHFSFARHFVPKNLFNRLLLDIDLYICTAGRMSEKCQVPGNLLTLGVPISIRIAVKDHSWFLHGFQKVLNVHRLEWPMREGAHLLRNSYKIRWFRRFHGLLSMVVDLARQYHYHGGSLMVPHWNKRNLDPTCLYFRSTLRVPGCNHCKLRFRLGFPIITVTILVVTGILGWRVDQMTWVADAPCWCCWCSAPRCKLVPSSVPTSHYGLICAYSL